MCACVTKKESIRLEKYRHCLVLSVSTQLWRRKKIMCLDLNALGGDKNIHCSKGKLLCCGLVESAFHACTENSLKISNFVQRNSKISSLKVWLFVSICLNFFSSQAIKRECTCTTKRHDILSILFLTARYFSGCAAFGMIPKECQKCAHDNRKMQTHHKPKTETIFCGWILIQKSHFGECEAENF